MTTFGVQLPNFTLGVADTELFEAVVDRAVAAEGAGFHSVWVMDHFFQLPPLGGPDQPMLEAYTLLGALAARTERVQLGTLVTGVTYRNPGMLAKIITTLDIISKGRAILGIGGAWYDVEHEALGFRYPPDKERLDRLEEAVQICRAMFRVDHANFKGEHYQLRDARNLPRPIQEGGPRIMIGGGGEKRTLKLVAQYADACNITGSVDVVRHKVEVLHNHCATVGRDPAEVSVTWMAPVLVSQSDEQTAETKEMMRAGGDEETVAGFLIGQLDELPDLVKPYVEAGVNEVIVSLPFASPEDIRAIGKSLIGALA
jgi:F420-dependent oxidoreductase-like protein